MVNEPFYALSDGILAHTLGETMAVVTGKPYRCGFAALVLASGTLAEST
jgi:hypothetical protein